MIAVRLHWFKTNGNWEQNRSCKISHQTEPPAEIWMDVPSIWLLWNGNGLKYSGFILLYRRTRAAGALNEYLCKISFIRMEIYHLRRNRGTANVNKYYTKENSEKVYGSKKGIPFVHSTLVAQCIPQGDWATGRLGDRPRRQFAWNLKQFLQIKIIFHAFSGFHFYSRPVRHRV